MLPIQNHGPQKPHLLQKRQAQAKIPQPGRFQACWEGFQLRLPPAPLRLSQTPAQTLRRRFPLMNRSVRSHRPLEQQTLAAAALQPSLSLAPALAPHPRDAPEGPLPHTPTLAAAFAVLRRMEPKAFVPPALRN